MQPHQEPNGPTITEALIEEIIVAEHYFTAKDGYNGAIAAETYVGRTKPAEGDKDLAPLELLTFCVLILKNGFTVTGQSACAAPENFDAEKGRKYARENAVNEVWKLEGYLLRQRLSEERDHA